MAGTLQENVVEILRKYWGDKPLREHKALVIGYGTIGSRLAEALFSKGISVAVFDSDEMKQMEADMSKHFQVLTNLNDLSSFTVIIGTSGETSLKGPEFWGLSHNVILISGSSEKVEFDLEALRAGAKKVEIEDIFTKYILVKDNKVVRVVLDGEPVNFALSEGISNAVIDPVYAEMFLGALQLVTGSGLENGVLELPKDTEARIYELYKAYHRR